VPLGSTKGHQDFNILVAFFYVTHSHGQKVSAQNNKPIICGIILRSLLKWINLVQFNCERAEVRLGSLLMPKGPFVNFSSFAFNPQINAGITSAGYTSPTAIQIHTIPPILEGRDVLGLAQTGTGKTAAFVLPILQHLLNGPRGKLRALILSPTRELAEQTHDNIEMLGRQTGFRSLTIYGGVSPQPQIKRLRAGREIAVACPGRLLDLMGQKVVNLSQIEILVIDEADRMFDMGFLPDIRRILSALPKKRQTLLFSATMPSEIRGLADELLDRPFKVDLGVSRPVETIGHAVYPVDQTRKAELLLALLRQSGNGQILVFTRTKHRAKKLADQLVKAGLPATSLQGNLSQNRRQAAMDNFRTGRVKVLVATDIAARGIDVSQISHVINFDMPDTADAYTHRIGRTGRMARQGTALTLVTKEDLPMVRTIEHLLGRSLEKKRLVGFEAI
jgi:ATP-dependent RNA helicase RhlE